MPKRKHIIVKPEEYEDIAKFNIIAHSCYVAHPWKGDENCIKFIQEELDVCARCKIQGLVVHLPKDNITSAQLLPFRHEGVRLYLETPAVVSTRYDAAKINQIVDIIREVDPHFKYFGICIDTAHLHTSGVKLTTEAQMRDLLSNLRFPTEILMFHLNDSERELGHGPDSHAPLGRGKIWETDRSGLTELLYYIGRNSIPTILERDENEYIADDIKFINSL